MSQTYPCWVCTNQHKDSEFPRLKGVPITFGGMGRECHGIYDGLDPVKRKRVREDGIARAEARVKARAGEAA